MAFAQGVTPQILEGLGAGMGIALAYAILRWVFALRADSDASKHKKNPERVPQDPLVVSRIRVQPYQG